MARRRASLAEIRGFYARQMAMSSKSSDPRLERIFGLVPREAFMPRPPWKIRVLFAEQYVETPSDDPIYLYQNTLVALDADRHINNGEPFLHARWIGAVAPQPGESVTHIGAGTGYYSAILSLLALPGGTLTAFEIDEELAGMARRNLAPFENVTVMGGNAVLLPLPPSDLIYVNASVVAPPAQWLAALRPGGRMIFPWHPSPAIAGAVILTRAEQGFAFKGLMPAWFIACVGASDAAECERVPDHADVGRTKSVHLRRDRAPDESATAVYKEVWFSAEPAEGAAGAARAV